MNKKIFYIVLAIVAVMLAVFGWAYYMKAKPAPVLEIQEPEELSSDTTDAIDEALEDIDIGDIDLELSDIDAQLENL